MLLKCTSLSVYQCGVCLWRVLVGYVGRCSWTSKPSRPPPTLRWEIWSLLIGCSPGGRWRWLRFFFFQFFKFSKCQYEINTFVLREIGVVTPLITCLAPSHVLAPSEKLSIPRTIFEFWSPLDKIRTCPASNGATVDPRGHFYNVQFGLFKA